MADKEKTTDTYKVEHDPITDVLTGGELALLAAYFPARRAARLDPAMVLRFE